jgi:hypothetical protein
MAQLDAKIAPIAGSDSGADNPAMGRGQDA